MDNLPQDWVVVRLEELVCSKSPICYGILMPGEHVKDGVAVVKVRDIDHGRINTKELLRTSNEIDQQYVRSRIAPGDLLLSIRGSPGVVAVVPDELTVANITQDTARIRPNGFVDRDYLFQVLNSELVQRQVRYHTIGQAVKGINIAEVRRLRVPLPPRPEQTAIARQLEVWDTAIRLLIDCRDTKMRLKQGLMQLLLTGNRRFPEFVHGKSRHHTPCGNLPRDWPLIPLRKVFNVVKRRNGTATTRVLTASGQHGLMDQRDFFNRSVAGRSIEDYYLLRKGEFAYNRSLMNGYPFGAIKRLDRYDEGALSTLYLCFAVNQEHCDSDFLVHFFESGLLNRQLRGIAQMGARAHGLLNVTGSDFFEMSMPLPSLPEQQRIAAALNALDRQMDLLRRQWDLSKKQKKGLMQKLLTGEVRVKV